MVAPNSRTIIDRSLETANPAAVRRARAARISGRCATGARHRLPARPTDKGQAAEVVTRQLTRSANSGMASGESSTATTTSNA